MSIASTLQDTKARLDSLLTFANETTGHSDASIGDAIRTLTDGFGGGSELLYDVTAPRPSTYLLRLNIPVQIDTSKAFYLHGKINKPLAEISANTIHEIFYIFSPMKNGTVGGCFIRDGSATSYVGDTNGFTFESTDVYRNHRPNFNANGMQISTSFNFGASGDSATIQIGYLPV